MSTTINRRPYSVNLPSKDSVKNYFFNQNKFKGLVEDKNFLETDPMSFSDCKNVYVDPDGVFKSRPSLDLYKRLYDEYSLIDLYNYKTDEFTYNIENDAELPDDTNEIWVGITKRSDVWYVVYIFGTNLSLWNTADFKSKPIIIKTNNKIYAVGEYYVGSYPNAGTYEASVAEMYLTKNEEDNVIFAWTPAAIYTPITEIVKGTAKIPAESPNVLTGSYRTRYLFDTINSTQYDDFVGKSVDVTIDGTTLNQPLWDAGQEQYLVRELFSYDDNYSIRGLPEDENDTRPNIRDLTGCAIYDNNERIPSILANNNYLVRYKILEYSYSEIPIVGGNNKRVLTMNISVELSTDFVSFSSPIQISNCISFPVITDDGLLVPVLEATEGTDYYAQYRICKLNSLGLEYSNANDLKLSIKDTTEIYIYGSRLFGFDAISEKSYVLIYPSYHFTSAIPPYAEDFDIRVSYSYADTVYNKVLEANVSPVDGPSPTGFYKYRYASTCLCKYRIINNKLYMCSIFSFMTDNMCKIRFGCISFNLSDLNTIVDNLVHKYTLSEDSRYYLEYNGVYLGIRESEIYTLFRITDVYGSLQPSFYYLTIDVSNILSSETIQSLGLANFAIVDNLYTYTDNVYLIMGIGVYKLNETSFNFSLQYNIIPYSSSILFTITANNLMFLAINANDKIVANMFDQYNLIVIDTTTEGELTNFNPDHYSYLSEHYFSEGNTLYISSTGLQPTEYEIEDIKGNIEHNSFEWYLPKMFTNEFDNDITYLHPISATEMAVFFEKEIYYVTFDTQNSVYRAYKTMHQVGLVEGGEVITTFDTKYVIFSSQRGLVAMSYQEFMATTEQSLNFLSDTIHDLYKVFNMTPVKLYKYDYWIVAYHENFNGAMLFDLRNNSWWPWEIPYNVTKIITYLDQDSEKGETTIPVILAEGSLYKFNRSEINYNDEGNIINWFFTSQRLPFALNYYKHIINLTFISLYDVEKLREHGWSDYRIGLKLRTLIYRTSVTNGELAPTPIYYNIDFVRTYVQRLNYSKVEEFQYQLESDDTNAHPLPLSITNMSIKYKIGSQVR